jgi:hypothetical protein
MTDREPMDTRQSRRWRYGLQSLRSGRPCAGGYTNALNPLRAATPAAALADGGSLSAAVHELRDSRAAVGKRLAATGRTGSRAGQSQRSDSLHRII